MRPSVEITPSELVSRTFYLQDGYKFSFEDRDYLLPIYDGMHKHMILCFGRQTEKSTYLCNRILLHMIANPGFQALYVAPETKHTSEFSRQKLMPRLKYSPIVDQMFFRGTDVDNVNEKELTNGSRIVLRSAYRDPLSCRGISADLVALDECQDMVFEHIPVIHETLSHSPHKIRLYAGTPKTRDDTLDRLWGRSNQTEWMFKCPEGHWARGDFSVIQRDGPRCPTCGREISRTSGEWVQGKQEAPIDGFRISQLLVPWVSWDDILEKLDTYPHEQFANEVLAIPMDSATHPLNVDDIVACCDSRQPMASRYVPNLGYSFAGIDWGTGGTSYTVLVILSIYNDKFVLWFAKRYEGDMSDPEMQIKDISYQCKKFGVQMIGADCGFGFVQNSNLRKEFGRERIMEFYSSHNLGKSIRWDKKADRYTIHRTTMMGRVVNGIKREQFKFPKWEVWRPFAQDLLHVQADFDENKRVMKYTHPENMPDDTFHALMYAMLTSEVFSGQIVIET